MRGSMRRALTSTEDDIANDVLVIWYCAICNVFVSQAVDPEEESITCECCGTETPRFRGKQARLQ